MAHVVSGTNSYLIIGEHTKIPIQKRSACDSLSIDSKFFEIADLEYWKQQGKKFGVDLLKRKITKVGKISMINGQKGVGVAAQGVASGRQQLTIRKRRRSIRQQRQQQQARRIMTLRKQSQCSLDLVDPDQISQWSVPLAASGAVVDDDHLESDLFASHSHSLPLVRSHSQQNFCDCDETEIYCYQTAPIEMTTADDTDRDYHEIVSNVEPHLNYYVENCRNVQIRDSSIGEETRGEYEKQYDDEDVYHDGITQNHVRDEDNLFDSLCHSGCQCSDNPQNSNNQPDLSRCAEIQKSEITAKAFLVYVDYYATKCDVKILNGDDISSQARDKWQNLTQKEKLPFLLQAYISDYMPKN